MNWRRQGHRFLSGRRRTSRLSLVDDATDEGPLPAYVTPYRVRSSHRVTSHRPPAVSLHKFGTVTREALGEHAGQWLGGGYAVHCARSALPQLDAEQWTVGAEPIGSRLLVPADRTSRRGFLDVGARTFTRKRGGTGALFSFRRNNGSRHRFVT